LRNHNPQARRIFLRRSETRARPRVAIDCDIMILTQVLSPGPVLSEHSQSSDVGFDGRGAAEPLSNFESRNYHVILQHPARGSLGSELSGFQCTGPTFGRTGSAPAATGINRSHYYYRTQPDKIVKPLSRTTVLYTAGTLWSTNFQGAVSKSHGRRQGEGTRSDWRTWKRQRRSFRVLSLPRKGSPFGHLPGPCARKGPKRTKRIFFAINYSRRRPQSANRCAFLSGWNFVPS
jgi:hypothetical protein